MLGLIFGDMVGTPFEGRNHDGNPHKSTDFELFSEGSHFSDDTVMAIAVADVLLHGKFYAQTLQEWGLKYPNAGYGGSFFEWLSHPPRQYNSWSNGSAMRAPPIGWARDGEEVLVEAKKSADVSHNHPYGVQGAQAVSYAVYLARIGTSVADMRSDLAHRFEYDLYRTPDMIRPNYKFETQCRKSVPEAIICALTATSVEEAIRLAVSLGGDADTQASIAGAIAQARFGFPAEYRAEVMSRIPQEMQDIVLEFEETFLP